MAIARRETIFDGAEAVYHCVSRCVRRAFLCGRDPYNGKSYEHRKAWVRNRMKRLSEVFGVEILAFAVMSNHLHLVLRTRPDWTADWGAEEVARRWLTIFPKNRDENGKPVIRSRDVRILAGMERRIEQLRGRLESVSWFMRCLNENIARRANIEDGCKGRFWEGRFYCQALLDEAAVLACMAYVDLNPVRAGLARTPEQSEFTSVCERIGRRGDGRPGWLCPIGDEEAPQRRGALALTRDEYLTLVDWTGRQVRADKPGAIPDHLEPLLIRLEIRPGKWVKTVRGFGGLFHRAAGASEAIRQAARRAGKQWLAGVTAARSVFSAS